MKNPQSQQTLSDNYSRRGNYFPWWCPSCGEWETTYPVRATWWENFWKGWEDFAVFLCPRCSHRYSILPHVTFPPRKPAAKNDLHADKVELQFMVVPELLSAFAYVQDPVRCRIVTPDDVFLTGLLGESGRKLVKAGFEFYFTRSLAEELINRGVAVASLNEKIDHEEGRATTENPTTPDKLGAELLLKRADDMLSRAHIMLDGWQQAVDWHRDYERYKEQQNGNNTR
jgi:hypothetical protein